MLTIQEAQENIRRTNQLWTKGRRDCSACIGIKYYGDYIKASAEPDQITTNQMMRALVKVYPNRTFRTWQECGYIYAESVGRKARRVRATK